jgi:hypothetical protein
MSVYIINILHVYVYVGYFYPYGIVKCDGFSTQIDEKPSKKLLYSSLQKYNVKISR